MRNASNRRQLAKTRKVRAKSSTTKTRQRRRKPVMHRRL